MSADNCIAIGEFPTKDGGKEYRVTHAQAVENLDFGGQEEQDYTRVCYFGDAKVFGDEELAMEEAERLAEATPVLEYGIQLFFFDRPLLDVSVKEANAWLKKKWNEEVSIPFLNDEDYQLIEPPPLPQPKSRFIVEDDGAVNDEPPKTKFSDLRDYPGMNGFSILNFKEGDEE